MNRRDRNKAKGILKKISGKWTPVIVAGGLLLGGGAALLSNDQVMAQANTAAVSMMSKVQSSDFSTKADLMEDTAVQEESQLALDNITADWEANSVEEVQAEIDRQAEKGLDTYTVQWGDTLEVLAEATGKSVDQISEENNIGNIELILTGDILAGILTPAEDTQEQPAQADQEEISQGQESEEEETENQESQQEDQQPAEQNEESNADQDSDSNQGSSDETAAEDQGNEETDDNDNQDGNENTPDTSDGEGQFGDEDPLEGTPVPTSDDETSKPVVNGESIPEENTEDQVGVTKTYEDTSVIKPGVQYKADETLPEGETVVESEGVEGELVITFTETLQEDGSVKREEISRDETPAQNRVIHVGTKEESKQTTSTSEREEVIPFETETKETDELPEGETQVQQEGVNGKVIETIEITKENGEEVNREVVDSETQEAQNEVILVGTGQSEEETETQPEPEVTEEAAAETVEIPYESRTVYTDDLAEGQTQVQQEGVNGEKELHYTLTLTDGVETNRELVDEVVTQDPVEEIVYVGTATPQEETPEEPEDTGENSEQAPEEEQNQEEESSETTPEEEQDQPSENEDTGENSEEPAEEESDQQSENGEAEETPEQTPEEEEQNQESPENDGEQVPETPAPGNEGESEDQVETVVETETTTESVPFETEYTENPEVEEGTETVVQEGQAGTRTITTEVTYENGEEVNRQEISNEITQAPVNQVVEVGSQQTTTETVTETEPIEFGSEVIETDQLAAGEERVVQEGQEGIRTNTFEVTYENGEEVSRQEVGSEVTQAPVNQVTEVGTAEEPAQSASVNNVEYTVQHGDTLYDVATGFGSTVEEVREANNLTSNVLSTGQDLIIPTAEVVPMDIPQSYDDRQVIMIDPGHGGDDGGAQGDTESEDNINLEISNRIQGKLSERGYDIIMTRDGDVGLSLGNRSQQANASETDLFISVHQNAAGGGANGIETFYYNYSEDYPSTMNEEYHNDEQRIANSKYLADLVQSNLIEDTGATDRGVKNSSLAVLRETDVPAILVETGFIDYGPEEDNLASPEYQDVVAEAIADAVDEYFSTVG